MALAATLSKEEIQQSLKAVIKRSKKKIPAPKYLCTPSSQQIQQKVSTLEEKHTICQQFRKLVCSHGSIPELQHVSASSMKKIYASHSTVADCSPERQKLPTVRCFVVRYLKNKFLEDASHRQFWSFVHIGANSVLRLLENLSGSVQRATDQPDPQICCVLLDSGWLKSQLGHHVAHLCSIYGVRLIVLRPVQTLAKLMSTDLHTISRCIAVGVCSSHTAPSELRDWIDLVCNSIPPLSLPLVTPPQLPLPQPLKRTVASSDSLTTTNTEVIAQPWDNYVTDPAKLYLPSDWTVPPDRIITLTALWRLFGNPKTEIRSRSDRKEAEEMEYLPLVGSDSFQIPYGDTLVRTVPGQTDAQRQNKKRDSRPSKKSKGKRKKKRRHNELQC